MSDYVGQRSLNINRNSEINNRQDLDQLLENLNVRPRNPSNYRDYSADDTGTEEDIDNDTL
jgi:hypothetical protein